MINGILKSFSYIFHPLLMPLFGVVFYFAKTPRFIPVEIVRAQVVALFILTLILPVLLYYLLKITGHVKTINLESTKERIYPLLINCLVLVLVLQRVVTPNQVIELYYFFVGILYSNLACLILVLFKFKASIHMIAVSGLYMFLIALSIHFKINISGTLALMAIVMGAVATSRLHLKAHTYQELITGAFVGLIPQLILVNYWL